MGKRTVTAGIERFATAGAFYVGMQSRFVDLDGPLLLAEDREHGIMFDGSRMHPPPLELRG